MCALVPGLQTCPPTLCMRPSREFCGRPAQCLIDGQSGVARPDEASATLSAPPPPRLKNPYDTSRQSNKPAPTTIYAEPPPWGTLGLWTAFFFLSVRRAIGRASCRERVCQYV